jgi:hypothetical protein
MGLGRINKLQLLTLACTKLTQSCYCIIKAFLVLKRATCNSTHKTHHGLDLGEATTFPLIVYYVPLHEAHIQMAFCPGTFATLGAHNFACRPWIEMRSEAKL